MNRNFYFKGYQVVTVAVIFLLSGYYLGTNQIKTEWKQYKPIINVLSKNPPASQSLNMQLFYDVMDKINKDYYDKRKIDAQKVLYGAITGMLASLDDPYTSFFPPSENSSFKTQLAGEFYGIGAELGMTQDKRIMIISPLDESPAKKSGVRSGDIIIKVDGQDTAGWSVSDAVDKIRGEKGTTVKLTILHEGSKIPVELKVVRDVIKIKSVTGEIRKVECKGNSCAQKTNCPACSAIMYVRISQFGDNTNQEWLSLVNSLDSQVKREKDFKGVVLDLRNNPGGYLQDAVFIASEFLRNGVVVLQEDNSGDRKELDVSRKGVLLDYPLILLVNKGSASASEIVAGALHDYGRARLVGERTFGKGTIQEAIDVDRGASVHISVAKWLTPKGTWVDKTGIMPDIPVELKVPEKETAQLVDNQLDRAMQELVK